MGSHSGSRLIAIEAFDVTSDAFLLDVDGTLIDIAPTPQSVWVPDSLRQDLKRLGRLTGGATALVSGRPLRDLDRLFGSLELDLVGGHGAEIRLWRDGAAEERHAPVLPHWLRQECIKLAERNPNILLEDKGYSIAIHYRLAPELEGPICNAVAAMLATIPAGGIEALHGKAVLEIKHQGIDKGQGIRTLMAHLPFAGRRPIFVGDDVTDEDAFAVMPEFDGIALSVGRSVKGADRRFETPAEVRNWIAQICRRGDRSP
jgi:trehalose 6-phosphate phosphatase